MAESFDKLVAETTTARVRERGSAKARKYLARMLLSEVRKFHGMGEGELADVLGITRGSPRKGDEQNDLRLSTLRTLVTALGGRLVVVAQFPEGEAGQSPYGLRRARRPRGRVVREVVLLD